MKTRLFVLTEVIYADDQKDKIIVEIEVHIKVLKGENANLPFPAS